jgi:L-alanine-DL-glutamate epimerase-like enolase superfamily enzyme
LWDIAGKNGGVPVHQLLGGGAADIACYASLVKFSDPSLVQDNVRRVIDA